MHRPPSIATITEVLFDSLALYPEGNGEFQTEDVNLLESLYVHLPSRHPSRLIGIVFCRPGSKYADEIIKDLPYYHVRSSNFVDFFFAGYGSDCVPQSDPEGTDVRYYDQWSFRPDAFISLCTELADRTTWTYEGGTDILLFAAIGDRKTLDLNLDFNSVIACNFEEMEKDCAMTSVGMFLEAIIKFGEKYDGDDPLWQLSDELGYKQVKSFALEVLLTPLPEPLRKLFKSAKHLVIRDVSKKK